MVELTHDSRPIIGRGPPLTAYFLTLAAISIEELRRLVDLLVDQAFVDENRDKLVRLYPMRRLGRVTDVAPTVVFLASEHASWITGQVVSVNGGFSMV